MFDDLLTYDLGAGAEAFSARRNAELPYPVIQGHQVHGCKVAVIDRPGMTRTDLDGYDAFVTRLPGVAIGVRTADCVPVLLYDPVKRVVAAVHAGWKGTVMHVSRRAVHVMMQQFRCDPGDLRAVIGPGIGPCCFETHNDVPDAMLGRWGEGVRPFCVPNGKGKFNVDLKAIIRWQLAGLGVPEENVETLEMCTGCHPELWWSHRKIGDRRGNHGAMIQLV